MPTRAFDRSNARRSEALVHLVEPRLEPRVRAPARLHHTRGELEVGALPVDAPALYSTTIRVNRATDASSM